MPELIQQGPTNLDDDMGKAHMLQEQARTANPRMPLSLLDPSNLHIFKAQTQKPQDTGAIQGESADKIAGSTLTRRALDSYAVTGKWQLSLARRVYAAAASSLAGRACSDVEVSTYVYEHVVAESVKVLGHIVVNGDVAVLGEVRGNVYCRTLLIGRQARIVGDVMAKNVVVQGRVIGGIHAERLTLQSTCYVVGEIYHRAVNIEQGACFEGKSRRSERRISIAAISAAPSEARDPEIEFANSEAQPPTALLAA